MSDVNAELLAAAKAALNLLTTDVADIDDAPVCLEEVVADDLRAAIARAEAAQGAEPNGGEESVGVTTTCACEPACGFTCAACGGGA